MAMRGKNSIRTTFHWLLSLKWIYGCFVKQYHRKQKPQKKKWNHPILKKANIFENKIIFSARYYLVEIFNNTIMLDSSTFIDIHAPQASHRRTQIVRIVRVEWNEMEINARNDMLEATKRNQPRFSIVDKCENMIYIGCFFEWVKVLAILNCFLFFSFIFNVQFNMLALFILLSLSLALHSGLFSVILLLPLTPVHKTMEQKTI